ncbi:hypothetical protein [Corallococcus aberystwythensis]|uniref:Uncharacterized protein n=1 Tax=Corallococcus aberystwythensis TaxID=2316722 RepID=A0A3A8RA49_9BACT|nr:hypothetical protein [Corallococcus aberystwythensis]RKH74162.1 hypothetical protein D7W81_02395 [Corallococcus aberystwythensis]
MRLNRSVCAAVVFAATCALAAPPAVQPFAKDVPGAVSKPTAGEKTVVDGVTIETSTLVSSKDVATLKAHFRALFGRNGLYIAEETEALKLKLGEQVTGLDTENLISYTVLFQPSGPGATTVIVSSANLGKRETKKVPPFAPVYPGSGAVMSTQLEWMKSMNYTTTATPAEIRAFYKEKLTALGYEARPDDEFVKGTERIALTVAPGVTERTVLLVQEMANAELLRGVQP